MGEVDTKTGSGGTGDAKVADGGDQCCCVWA